MSYILVTIISFSLGCFLSKACPCTTRAPQPSTSYRKLNVKELLNSDDVSDQAISDLMITFGLNKQFAISQFKNFDVDAILNDLEAKKCTPSDNQRASTSKCAPEKASIMSKSCKR